LWPGRSRRLTLNEGRARARAVVLNQSQLDRRFRDQVDRYYDTRVAAIRADLLKGIDAENITDMDAGAAAWSILAMYRGVDLVLLQRPDGCDTAQLIDAFIERVVHSLRRWTRLEPR